MERRSSKDCLAHMQCTPCKGGVSPLKEDEIQPLFAQLTAGWTIVDNHHIERVFTFKNFIQALEFTIQVGRVAESLGHHPDIYLSWGKVKLDIWTHKINGLHINDFILAKKIDSISS